MSQPAQSVPTTLPNPFHTFPHTPKIPVSPYTINIPQSKIDDLKRRLDDAPTPRTTFENSHTDEQLGLTRKWLVDAVEEWKKFDWRKSEERLNALPNYTAKVKHLDVDFDVHFIALFSKKEDAVPIVMTHGWPGSVIEFVPLLEHLSKLYTRETLPIHLVVPSLIGYGFSSPPPIDRDFTTRDDAAIFDKLMKALGFEKYIAQGGDVGALVSSFLGADFDACQAVHLNMLVADPKLAEEIKTLDLNEFDRKAMDRFDHFQQWEFAYKHEHATKSGTIGFVLESSPIALLSWIGEKFIVWSDETPSLNTILSNTSIYWFNQTISTGLYHYRSTSGKKAATEFKLPKLGDKPVGYSFFAKEIHPVPKVWAEKILNLVWFKQHETGGHFAALEKTEEFWEDVKDFVDQVWKK